MKPEDWISVKERLPKDGERVLGAWPDDLQIVYRSNGQWLHDSDYVNGPTHWLSVVLPTPPDAFEEWWEKCHARYGGTRAACWAAWDASRKSIMNFNALDAERAFLEWESRQAGSPSPSLAYAWHAAVAWLRKEAGL